MPDAGELLLRDFAPRSMLHVPEHRIDRAAARVADVHNHLGRWHLGRWTVPEVGPLLELMDACNVDTIVNLDGCWEDRNPPGSGRWNISGLALDTESLRKVYGDNARRLIPATRTSLP